MLISFRKGRIAVAFVVLLIPAAAHAYAPRHSTYAPESSQAEPTCPKGDQPVWVNTRSSVYHYRHERWYGNTKYGQYECEKDAQAEGRRPTRNGQ
ncbi:hypothetical protein CFR80_16945 [Komagataeibacter oboediens]|uniref:Uncharacterized protein n=1 Tax=Komagataeibacter oboediens TaxID=65958 RepID=A0A318QKW3_9PROT|nr:hypothetical protein CFR80_16945 [Komagataeibacter oboediens]